MVEGGGVVWLCWQTVKNEGENGSVINAVMSWYSVVDKGGSGDGGGRGRGLAMLADSQE